MSFINHCSSDNYITNFKDWERITEFIPKDKIIWSPFYCDGMQKEYFEKLGYDIIHEDKDFFNYEPKKYDIIIDNIPFSKKKEILERLKKLNKPFIIICPSMLLSYKYFQDNYKNNIQILVPYTRLKFKHLEKPKTNYTAPFASFYYCYKMNLKKDLFFLD